MGSAFKIVQGLERNVEGAVKGIFIDSTVRFGACGCSRICTRADRQSIVLKKTLIVAARYLSSSEC